MKEITVNNVKYPVRFNKRALSNFEKATGRLFGEKETAYSIENMIQLAFEGLKEGHRLAKKTFKLTIDDLYDLDDEHGFVDKVIAVHSEEEKKQQ